MKTRDLVTPLNHWIRAIALVMALMLSLTFRLVAPAAMAVTEPRSLTAPTPVCGVISANRTWTTSASPYLVTCDVTVAAGAILTIQPGVEVDFSSTTGLVVLGKISAVGTATHPITFTAVDKTPGEWVGVTLQGPPGAFNSGSIFDYVTMEYGAYPNGDANLHVYHASAEINHSTFRYSKEYGIATDDTGWVDVSDSTFTGNVLGAMYFRDPSADQRLANLTIQGNGASGDKDFVVVGGGSITSAVAWEIPAPGIPYIIEGDVVVESGGTLAIDSGVEVQFSLYTITAYEDGQLTADGTPTQPITFTSATKTAGAWDGIRFSGSNDKPNLHSRLRYVTIEYGGRSGGNIYMEWAYPLISHCTLSHSLQYGIYGRVTSGPRVSYTTISDSADYAIYLHEANYHPEFDHLTASGNGPSNNKNAIAFGGGSLTGEALWPNADLPYIVLGDVSVDAESSLTIEPGVKVRFAQSRGLDVRGRLLAIGTAAQPITLTGTSATRGWWDGIRFEGYEDAPSVGSRLDHVTIEYGGYSYANISTFWGQVTISDSTIRLSSKDGVYAQLGGNAVSISSSRIVQNGAYGVRNGDWQDTVILAANNWWGDASGPTFAGECGGGTGSQVSAGVDFAPVLADAGGEAGLLSPSTLFVLTLEPDRWFVPADGTIVSVIKATLRDGAGRPVPGREVLASSTLGSVQAGGITGVTGETFILVSSDSPGDAVVTARVDQAATPCDLIRSASTQITFTPWVAGEVSLTPDSSSPYTSGSIQVGPQPLMRGTPAVVTVTLTNPYDHPILVNAVLGILQSGIGLTSGPLKQWQDIRIEAHAVLTLRAPTTPAVEGHWCFSFDYSWREPGSAVSVQATSVTVPLSIAESGTGEAGINTNSQPASTNSQAMGATFGKQSGNINARNYGETTTPPSSEPAKKNINRQINDSFSVTRQIGDSMRGDPPSQDYTTIVMPVKPVMPVYITGDDGLTADQATAVNMLLDALSDAIANGRAVLGSDDRYAGAAAAGNQTWQALQTAAVLHYKQETGFAYLRVADALQQWLDVYAGDHVPSVADVAAYQQRLVASGFTAEEIAGYTALGCSDEEIAWIQNAFIARDPAEMAISARVEYAETIVEYRALGNMLAYPSPTFSQEAGLAGGGVGMATSNVASLAAFGEVAQSIEVGNPLPITTTVELRVRPLGMPADWGVMLTPRQLTLGPGEHQPVTVRILPAGVSAQGTVPSMAVEGYVDDELLGGVEFRVAVPTYTPFTTGLRVFLPLVVR